MDILFPGFSAEAFEILERLRENPWAEQYQKEKIAIQREIMQPFKLLRDDLVIHWLIPNDLDLVTEKNVFSRFLKNDFGKGGCNHHLWFSFYRPGFKRLTDLQLAYSLFPEGLNVGIYAADRAKESMWYFRQLVESQSPEFIRLVNTLLSREGYYVVLKYKKDKLIVENAVQSLGVDWQKATEIWIKTTQEKKTIVNSKAELFDWIIETAVILEPLYKFWLKGSTRPIG